jgi:hypothetical protein
LFVLFFFSFQITEDEKRTQKEKEKEQKEKERKEKLAKKEEEKKKKEEFRKVGRKTFSFGKSKRDKDLVSVFCLFVCLFVFCCFTSFHRRQKIFVHVFKLLNNTNSQTLTLSLLMRLKLQLCGYPK